MPKVTLKWHAGRHKVAVIVRHSDGEAVAMLTAQQLAALWASPRAVPPGLTQQEWESGGYTVAGYDMEKGDVRVEPDGRRFVKYHDRINPTTRRFEQRVFEIPSNVNIPQGRLDRLDANRTQLDAFGAPADILAIVNGELEFNE